MSALKSFAWTLPAALVLTGLMLCGRRVVELERDELERDSGWTTLAQLASAPGSTRLSARLTQVELRAGEHAAFEVCARDRMDPERWTDAFELAVFQLPKPELMLRVPLDAPHLAVVKRSARGACLSLGGGVIERSAAYALDAVWPTRPPPTALLEVELNARVLARGAIGGRDRAYVIGIALGALLAVASLLLSRRGARATAPAMTPQRGRARTKPLLGAGVGLFAVFALMQVPSEGAGSTLLKGGGLVALQAAIAFGLVRVFWPGNSRAALALEPPPRPVLMFAAVVASAALLVLVARVALRIVPHTGEAPIQTFIEWPSGMLCFAALGGVLPLGEELFFRGYLYRAALGFGPRVAFMFTLLAFVTLHAQQSWGNWGALSSIAAAGALLTALRAWSGSVLVPAGAHLLYNFALSMASF